MPSGYSGTPLAKKLGIKPGHRVAVLSEPPELQELLAASLPDDVDFQAGLLPAPDVAIAFLTELSRLEESLETLADAVFPDRVIWIAWPKRASGLPTDLSDDVVRDRPGDHARRREDLRHLGGLLGPEGRLAHEHRK